MFQAWEDLCEWFYGSVNNDNNANQFRFRFDTLKFTTQTKADQCIQDFLEIKTLLDELEERHTKSSYISKFLGNITEPDYAEDARSLSRDRSNQVLYMKIMCRAQRKIDLEREKNISASGELIQ